MRSAFVAGLNNGAIDAVSSGVRPSPCEIAQRVHRRRSARSDGSPAPRPLDGPEPRGVRCAWSTREAPQGGREGNRAEAMLPLRHALGLLMGLQITRHSLT